MKLPTKLILFGGWLFLFAAALSAAESLSVRLQKAIFAEETEGNLDAAIQIYQEIARETEANRPVAAQAQYRLGMCLLKRGRSEEATGAFRQIIQQFSDQTQIVGQARERLAELGKPPSAVVVRQVWSGWQAFGETVSPDGRYLASSDWDTGNLTIRDLATSQSRPLTDQGSFSKRPVQYSESCAFSRDGEKIAYSWYSGDGTNDSHGLRIVTVKEGKSRAVIDQQTNGWYSAEDWSPDGQWIAAFHQEGQLSEPRARILLANVSNGTTRRLDVPTGELSRLRFSPDGRYLAYNRKPVRGAASDPSTNGIFIVEVETGVENLAVPNLTRESFVDWAPRGTEILFSSDLGVTPGLWSLPLENGEPKGKPRLLKADLGEVIPIGLTREGALFYNSISRTLRDFYVASVDFESGRVLAPPKAIRSPSLAISDLKTIGSRDKRFLYFRSRAKEGPVVHILDLESGRSRELANSRAWADRIGWWWLAPDNQTLLVSLSAGVETSGLYRVNTQTGEIVPFAIERPGVRLLINNPIRLHFDANFAAYARLYTDTGRFVLVKHDLTLNRETEHEIPGLSAESVAPPYRNRATLLSDGRTVLFNRKHPAADSYALIRHDLVTGAQQEFLSAPAPIGIVSTDPSRIFVVTADERQRLVFTLFSVSGSAWNRESQVTVPEGYEFRGEHWGGPDLLLAKTSSPDRDASAELWTLSFRNGELRNIGLTVPSHQFWSLKENEQTLWLQFTGTPASMEVWVMENFLPQVAAAK